MFSDVTLRDMARRRPSTIERLLDVHGVGQKKSSDVGTPFVNCIVAYCQKHDVSMDQQSEPLATRSGSNEPSTAAVQSFLLFDEGLSVEQMAERLQRTISTTYQYLEAYIHHRHITDAGRWMPAGEFEQLQVVAQYAGTERLKPIYEALHERISYDKIRIAVACLTNRR